MPQTDAVQTLASACINDTPQITKSQVAAPPSLDNGDGGAGIITAYSSTQSWFDSQAPDTNHPRRDAFSCTLSTIYAPELAMICAISTYSIVGATP